MIDHTNREPVNLFKVFGMLNEQCVCGHVQQRNGIAWKPDGGVHSVIFHRGECRAKKCKHCKN